MSRERAPTPVSNGFPSDLVIAPTQRRPLRLPDETVQRVLSFSMPSSRASQERRPRVSVIVVAFNGLVYTRLCLETLLACTDGPAYEVLVVDNASTDGTAQYLMSLAARRPNVRVFFSDTNAGFAAANNRALAEAGGDVLVLLNNDTLLTRGWLRRLVRHLDDPTIGLVGPVTNRTCNEAQIAADYSTLGGLSRFTRSIFQSQGRASGAILKDIRMLSMFCVAMRRSVYEQVGPLDERFGLGTFEDEDYSVRVRNAGHRVVCAEDVFVHHFGHASFGELIPSGVYHGLLADNRRIFEEKWGVEWEPYARRTTEDYARVKDRVREVVPRSLPSRAEVLVVSKGDDDLLRLSGLRARHFPQTADGTYSGSHPAADADAIRQLEALRETGAEFLVIPKPSLWWLDHYTAFREHLERHHQRIMDDSDTCFVYELRGRRVRAS